NWVEHTPGCLGRLLRAEEHPIAHERIAEQPCVGVDLVRVAPAGDEAGILPEHRISCGFDAGVERDLDISTEYEAEGIRRPAIVFLEHYLGCAFELDAHLGRGDRKALAR